MRNQKIIAGLLMFCLTLALNTPVFADDFSTNSTVTKGAVVEDGTNRDNVLGLQLGPSVGSASVGVAQGPIPQSDIRTRPMLGMFYEHRFMPYLTFRPEFNYVQRDFGTTSGQGQNEIVSDLTADYFEIPLLAKAQYPFQAFTPYVVTGPFLGLLVGKSMTVSQGINPSQDENSNNLVNTFNFGWDLGAGSSYAITKTVSADIGLRYSMEFTNALSSNATSGGDSVKLNAFQFLAGLGFAI